MKLLEKLEEALKEAKEALVSGYHKYLLPVVKHLGEAAQHEVAAVASAAADHAISAVKDGVKIDGDLAKAVLHTALEKAKTDAPSLCAGAVMSLAGAALHAAGNDNADAAK